MRSAFVGSVPPTALIGPQRGSSALIGSRAIGAKLRTGFNTGLTTSIDCSAIYFSQEMMQDFTRVTHDPKFECLVDVFPLLHGFGRISRLRVRLPGRLAR